MKLTKKELESLNRLMSVKESIISSLGNLELNYQRQKEAVLNVNADNEKEYNSLIAQIKNKYGDGIRINQETGEVTKKESELVKA